MAGALLAVALPAAQASQPSFWDALMDEVGGEEKVRRGIDRLIQGLTRRTALEIQRIQAPHRYPDGSVLVDARAEGRALTITIEAPGYSAADVVNTIAEQRPALASVVCGHRRLKSLLELGATVTYRYVTERDEPLGEVTFTKADCAPASAGPPAPGG